MSGFFYDFFRAAGITMPPGNNFERIRSIGERMARTIEVAAETKAIEVIRRLQVAVSSSFDKVEKHLKAQDVVTDKNTRLISGLIEQQAAAHKRTTELAARIRELENPPHGTLN
jgi:hypothetical protein